MKKKWNFKEEKQRNITIISKIKKLKEKQMKVKLKQEVINRK